MSVSEFDSYRPPEEPRRKRKGKGRRRAPGSAFRRGGDGSREMPMVPEPDFTSYYGRPIVKAPPWEKEIGAYLFLAGLLVTVVEQPHAQGFGQGNGQPRLRGVVAE